ncbi:MAG: urea transport system substrate-binding protein [Candidatus Poriferisodalaceae bacterium]
MRTHKPRLLVIAFIAFGLFAAACGSDDPAEDANIEGTTAELASTDSTADEAAPAGSEAPIATEAEGETIKVGILHSLSGTMSISETAVVDAELLAIQEINEAGGVLGRMLEPIVEDGASDWPTFAEKAEKLLTTDEVTVVFGGWTSASRKAMLPVFEGLDGLLFYPVQYEGLEASPNIFYTGATANQQIIPALDYMVEQGLTNVYLVGSDYVFPRTANAIIKAYAEANGLTILGEEYLPLGVTDGIETIVSNIIDSDADIVFNSMNGDQNVAFFKELSAKGNTPDQIQTVSVSVAEEEITGIGVENIEGHLTSWNYYQTVSNPANSTFVDAFKAEYGTDRVTADPIEAAYVGVKIWAAAVEAAGSTDVAAVREAAKGLTLEMPEGLVTVSDWNQHIFKTGRIGVVNSEGLIDTVWESDSPIEPDPCLANYPWAAAAGLDVTPCEAQLEAAGS